MKEKQHKIKMFFVGIDLAWSTRNGSGIVILKGDKSKVNFVCGDVLHSDKEIINYRLNCKKISSEIGWKPRIKLLKGIDLTIKWYKENINLFN